MNDAELLEHYMSLKYPITVTGIPKSEGGGVNVSIPQLGVHAYSADGETLKEALENLEHVKRDLFELALAKGIKLPEPEK